MAENLANSPRINKIEAVKQWLRDRDPVRDAAAAGNPYAEQMLRLDEFGERIGERFLREKEDRFPNKMSEISIDVDGYHMPLIVPESTPEELLYLGSLMASGKKLDFEDPFMQQIRQKAVDNFVQSLQSTGEYVRGVTGFKPFEGEGAPYGYRHKTNVPKSEGWQGLIDIGGDAEEDFKQFLRGENEMPNVMGREFPYTPEGMAAADNYRRAMGMRGGGMMGFRPLGYKDGAEVRNPGDSRISAVDAAAIQILENDVGTRFSPDEIAMLLQGRGGAIKLGRAYGDSRISNFDIEQYRRLAPQAGSQYGDPQISNADAAALGRIAAGVVAQNPGVSDRDLMMLGRLGGGSRNIMDLEEDNVTAAQLNALRAANPEGSAEYDRLRQAQHEEHVLGIPPREMMPDEFKKAMEFRETTPVFRNRGGLMSLRRR